jgi:hypothetical protein
MPPIHTPDPNPPPPPRPQPTAVREPRPAYAPPRWRIPTDPPPV